MLDADVNAVISEQIYHNEQWGFTVVATAYAYHIDYKIYEVAGWAEGSIKGKYDKPVWSKPDDQYTSTDNLEEAALYLHGSVKWDGCSNWHFDEQDRVMLHGCSRENLQSIGDVMTFCWDLTSKLCPNWYY